MLQVASAKGTKGQDEPEEEVKEGSGELSLQGVKSNKAALQDKKKREDEVAKMISEGLDDEPMGNVDFVRQPNAVSKGGAGEEAYKDPTRFLQGFGSPRLESFNNNEDSNCVQIEGEMIRKATETKLKQYWYALLGKELYVYKS